MLGFPIRGISATHITDDQRRAALRRVIRSCPACHGDLDGHLTFVVAMVQIQSPESVSSQELQQLVADRRWSSANRYREWKADGDMREFRAVRCAAGGLALLTIVYAYEMWSDDFVEGTEIIEGDAAADLTAFVGNRWEQL
jgi:hypothetical protein